MRAVWFGRFMRFMERYAEENDLGFTKNKKDNGQ